MAPIFTGFRFGFGRGESDVPTLGFEYVLFGGTSGTIVVPSSISSIKIAGCGGGVNGNLQGPGQQEYGGGNGGRRSCFQYYRKFISQVRSNFSLLFCWFLLHH